MFLSFLCCLKYACVYAVTAIKNVFYVVFFFCTWLSSVPLSRKNVTIREFIFAQTAFFAFKQDLF